MYDLTSLPVTLTLTADSLGRAQVECQFCKSREWLDTGKPLHHRRYCQAKAQLRFAEPPAAAEPGVANKNAKLEVAEARAALPRGSNVCEHQSSETVARWVKAGAVSQDEAMNTDF